MVVSKEIEMLLMCNHVEKANAQLSSGDLLSIHVGSKVWLLNVRMAEWVMTIGHRVIPMVDRILVAVMVGKRCVVWSNVRLRNV